MELKFKKIEDQLSYSSNLLIEPYGIEICIIHMLYDIICHF